MTDALAPRPRPRVIGTHTAGTHPRAIARGTPISQLAFEIWDDQDDDEQPAARGITDVPTGALL
ncbi:hypothetical protein [Streptomyces sp. NPDC048663]|uniref:hypothetical protein n=1 Tax=Streptomyces sp. NPDC048663 TaxID=3155638 RepID=UPI0034265AEA